MTDSEVVEICRRLHSRNMLASADGNVSFRVSDNEIHITPTGLHKAYMNVWDMAVITLDNEVVRGQPSGERLMHLEVYRRCPKARVVIHAHPPHAIAWSVARPELTELPSEGMSELILAVGRIPIVPYGRPGTLQMGTNLASFLPDSRVMILARHGALSWGEDIEEAYNGMERLEHSAQILFLAETLGGVTPLPDEEIHVLREMRKKLGDKSL